MFWKRPVNVNFVMILIVILILCGIAGLMGLTAYITWGYGTEAAGESNISNWATSLATVSLATVIVVAWFMFILTALLFIYAAVMLALLIIARCVYRNQGGRLLAYRILMGIVYGMIFLLIIGMVFMFVTAVPLVVFTLTLIFLSLTIYSMVNTYSARIKRY